MPVRAPRPTAAAVLLVLGLTACGGGSSEADRPSDSPSTSPSASPSTPGASPSVVEGRLAGPGYSFTLPEGWEDATDQFQEYSALIDAGAVDAAQAGQDFRDNVNVQRNEDQAELPPAQAAEQFSDELRTVATRVQVQPTATVGGIDVLHLTGRTGTGEVTARTDQYIAHVAGGYYVVTFSYGTGTPRTQREDEVAAVLDSWAWG